jgi:hypothetical protein
MLYINNLCYISIGGMQEDNNIKSITRNDRIGFENCRLIFGANYFVFYAI